MDPTPKPTPSFQVRVEYEPLPPCADLLFAGKLEGNAGKDRSQRSNFLADAYTDAEVIAMFDAEVSHRHDPLRELLTILFVRETAHFFLKKVT